MEIELERAYKICYLLHVDIIKNEIASMIKGHKLVKGLRTNGTWEFTFKNDLDEINLDITHNEISIRCTSKDYYQFITINKLMLMKEYKLEKRTNGFIFRMLKKQYSQVSIFANDIILTDLMEDRFVLTKEDIVKYNLENNNLKDSLVYLIKKAYEYDFKNEIASTSSFSTHLIKNYPKTYLNGRDISNIYLLKGQNIINRIYNLYQGIINEENISDLENIGQGILNEEAYDLKELKGIKTRENSLVGYPLANDEEYLRNYLSKLGYKGKELNRDIVLKEIKKVQKKGFTRILKKRLKAF